MDEDKWGHYALATRRATRALHLADPADDGRPRAPPRRVRVGGAESGSGGGARGKARRELLAAVAAPPRVPDATDALHAVAERCNARETRREGGSGGVHARAYLCAFLGSATHRGLGRGRRGREEVPLRVCPSVWHGGARPARGPEAPRRDAEDDRESGAALSVTVAFDPGARDVSSAAIETATSATVTRAARKSRQGHARGPRRFLAPPSGGGSRRRSSRRGGKAEGRERGRGRGRGARRRRGRSRSAGVRHRADRAAGDHQARGPRVLTPWREISARARNRKSPRSWSRTTRSSPPGGSAAEGTVRGFRCHIIRRRVTIISYFAHHCMESARRRSVSSLSMDSGRSPRLARSLNRADYLQQRTRVG